MLRSQCSAPSASLPVRHDRGITDYSRTSGNSGPGTVVDTHFVFAAIPSKVNVKKPTGRGSETYRALYRTLMWDLQQCATGVYSELDEFGQRWPEGHPRMRLAGQPIAGPWKLAHLRNRGDLDFHANDTELQHWSCASPCFRLWMENMFASENARGLRPLRTPHHGPPAPIV